MRNIDWVHFQFAGSDYNPVNRDGGGLDQSDRGHLVQVGSVGSNIPLPYDQWTLFSNQPTRKIELARKFALLGQTDCKDTATIANDRASQNSEPNNCAKLNKAPAYFDGGVYQLSVVHMPLLAPETMTLVPELKKE
eukprot:TRINITY_DN8981_c0_g1_i1.p1 TRINITY_DN8981_c0_g1~~TRINITY_DN8981_c0_g1_i1.p1  ORF type:complete len:136 (-),score=29.92 TRINITY_DN8981_c0_g1_i1:312-719(-)